MATLLFKYRSPSFRGPVPEAPPASAPAPLEPENDVSDDVKRDRWWYESSYDLRSGLDVDDDLASTLPGELIDQWFKR